MSIANAVQLTISCMISSCVKAATANSLGNLEHRIQHKFYAVQMHNLQAGSDVATLCDCLVKQWHNQLNFRDSQLMPAV
jgi:hypothetical protein